VKLRTGDDIQWQGRRGKVLSFAGVLIDEDGRRYPPEMARIYLYADSERQAEIKVVSAVKLALETFGVQRRRGRR
jgi:hypothetical protein